MEFGGHAGHHGDITRARQAARERRRKRDSEGLGSDTLVGRPSVRRHATSSQYDIGFGHCTACAHDRRSRSASTDALPS